MLLLDTAGHGSGGHLRIELRQLRELPVLSGQLNCLFASGFPGAVRFIQTSEQAIYTELRGTGHQVLGYLKGLPVSGYVRNTGGGLRVRDWMV